MTKTDLLKLYFEQSHLFNEQPELLFELLGNCIEFNHNDLFYKWVTDKMINFHYIGFVYTSTLIHMASACENIEILKYLLNKGVDINLKNHFGYTPLIVAAEYEEFETVKFLVENGADVNIKSNTNESAIQCASRHNKDEIKNYLTNFIK